MPKLDPKWALEFADNYLQAVRASERSKNVIDIIFGHVPTLSVLPTDIRERHLKNLVRGFSDPERTYYYNLYSKIGEEFTRSNRPKLINIMLQTSWEEVVTRQKTYHAFNQDDIMRLMKNMSELTDKGTYELILVADALLRKRQGEMWHRVNAWETIARVGQSLAVFRNWDLSLWWSKERDTTSRTSELLESLRGLGRPAVFSYYEGNLWLPAKKDDKKKEARRGGEKGGQGERGVNGGQRA